MLEKAWEEFRLAFCQDMTGKVLESRKKFFFAGALAACSMALSGMQDYGPTGMAENIARAGRQAQFYLNSKREPEEPKGLDPEVLQ